MNSKHKLMIYTLAMTLLVLTGCSSPKPAAAQYSREWLTLPPQATYTNSTPFTQTWASEGVIREKDQALQNRIHSQEALEPQASRPGLDRGKRAARFGFGRTQFQKQLFIAGPLGLQIVEPLP